MAFSSMHNLNATIYKEKQIMKMETYTLSKKKMSLLYFDFFLEQEYPVMTTWETRTILNSFLKSNFPKVIIKKTIDTKSGFWNWKQAFGFLSYVPFISEKRMETNQIRPVLEIHLRFQLKRNTNQIFTN